MDCNITLPTKARRWYDQDPTCIRMILVIREISQPEIREASSRLLLQMAEKILHQIQQNTRGGPVSLGLPAIQELFLSRREQRRWYDIEPTLKKAVGTLYSLPSVGLSALAFQLTDTMELLMIYSYACQRLDQPPTAEDLTEIIKTTLFEGRDIAEDLLTNIIGQDIFETLNWELQQAALGEKE